MENSLLNRLPAEVRNSIYRYALTNVSHGFRDLGEGEPPLLRTCKQIRQESRLMYFACNGFTLTVDEEHAQATTDRIKNFDDAALQAMRFIGLDCKGAWSK